MRASSRIQALASGTFAIVIAACGGGPASQTPATATPTQAATPTATQAATPATTEAPSPTATQPPAEPTADPLAFVAQFEGTYTGTWVNETFGSNGPVSIQVTLDRAAGAVELKLTLGGNVFGNPEPKPETLTATIEPGEGLSFTSKTFGETTVTVDLEAGAPVVTIASPNVPSDRIRTFTATTAIVNPSTFEFEYEVTFRDGIPPATGRATLSR